MANCKLMDWVAELANCKLMGGGFAGARRPATAEQAEQPAVRLMVDAVIAALARVADGGMALNETSYAVPGRLPAQSHRLIAHEDRAQVTIR